MRIMSQAAITLELSETQKKRVISSVECGWCGLIAYVERGIMWECPSSNCVSKGGSRSYIHHCTPRVYQQIRRLKRKRGEVIFKRNSYWGKDYDTSGFPHQKKVSFACHGTGRQDYGLSWKAMGDTCWLRGYRQFRKAGSVTGGDPRMIASHLRFIRGTEF